MASGKITALVLAAAVVGVVAIVWSSYLWLGKGVEMSVASDVAPSVYELSTASLEGETVELSQFSGKVALAVNVASRCGMTPQYEGLQALHEEFSDKGFSVLGFPSNDFMGQEPGTSLEIRNFCEKNYGVSFPMFAKRKVKGAAKDEIYAVLSQQLEEPTWNFTKYLVGRDGRVLGRFGPRITPQSEELRGAIEAALAD